MSKEANKKNQEKLKAYLRKINDTKSNSKKNNRLRKPTSTN